MQAMGTVALQTEGVTNGLITLAGQSRSLEVLEAAREANRTADPMAYGRLMLAVQKELGLTYKRGGGASSLRSNAKELAAYMREKGQMGDPMIAELLEQRTQSGFTSETNDGMMRKKPVGI